MKQTWDKSLLMSILALIGIGLVQVYSSSYILATERFDDPFYFIRKQLLFSIFGILSIFIGMSIPWHKIEKNALLIWISATILILLTYVPGIGVKVGGAQRWINIGFGFRLEASELLKISFPLFFAWYAKKYRDFSINHHIIAILFFIGPLLMLLKQPDFGSCLLIVLVAVSLLFVSGLHLKYFAGLTAILLPTFYFLVMQVPYRRARVLAFLNPWKESEDGGFQLLQSLLSFKSGGLFGEGLGLSQGKLYFLPEAHTDFILSVFAEETGFIGFFLLLILYGFVIVRGFKIASQTEDAFSKWVALGVILIFTYSVLINVGVVLGMLPTKGLTLPLVSYGGTSLIAFCFAFGILLNINRHQTYQKQI